MYPLSLLVYLTCAYIAGCMSTENAKRSYFVDSDNQVYVASITRIARNMVNILLPGSDNNYKYIELQDGQIIPDLQDVKDICIQNIASNLKVADYTCFKSTRIPENDKSPICSGKLTIAVYPTDCRNNNAHHNQRNKRFVAKIFDGLKDAKVFIHKTIKSGAEEVLDSLKNLGKKVMKKIGPVAEKAVKHVHKGIHHVVKKVKSFLKTKVF